MEADRGGGHGGEPVASGNLGGKLGGKLGGQAGEAGLEAEGQVLARSSLVGC